MDFSGLKKGAYIVLRDQFPCKIVEVQRSKPGKHGSAKAHVVGMDVITDKKYDGLFNHSTLIKVPEINRLPYQLLNIDDEGYMTLMTDAGETREDLQLGDDDVSGGLRESFEAGEDLTVTLLFAKVEGHPEQYRIVESKRI